MRTNLLRGSVTYGAVTIFARVASVILIPILTRLLSPVEYGTLSMALTIVTLANLIATLEISQAVTFFFTNRNRANHELYPGTAFRFSMAMYFFIFAIAAIFGELIFRKIAHITIGAHIIIDCAALLAANGIFFLVQNQLRLEFKTREYAGLTIGYVILTSVGAVGGAMLFSQPEKGVILGQAAGAAIIALAGVVMLWERYRINMNFTRLRKMLKFSFPLVPAGLLLLGGQQVPKFILSIYSNLEDVGIYGLAYQIAGFSALAVLGVQTAITPSVLANHEDSGTPKMLGKLFERFAIVALIFCSGLSIFAGELIMIFSVPSYESAAKYVPFLAFAISLNSLYIFFPGKIIRGKSASQLIASAGSFLVAVLAGVFLIKIDGVRGAALATLLSAATFFLIWSMLSQKLYRLPVNWIKLLLAAAFAAVVCAVGILLIPEGITFYTLAIKSALLLLFSCVIAWEHITELWKRFIR